MRWPRPPSAVATEKRCPVLKSHPIRCVAMSVPHNLRHQSLSPRTQSLDTNLSLSPSTPFIAFDLRPGRTAAPDLHSLIYSRKRQTHSYLWKVCDCSESDQILIIFTINFHYRRLDLRDPTWTSSAPNLAPAEAFSQALAPPAISTVFGSQVPKFLQHPPRRLADAQRLPKRPHLGCSEEKHTVLQLQKNGMEPEVQNLPDQTPRCFKLAVRPVAAGPGPTR